MQKNRKFSHPQENCSLSARRPARYTATPLPHHRTEPLPQLYFISLLHRRVLPPSFRGGGGTTISCRPIRPSLLPILCVWVRCALIGRWRPKIHFRAPEVSVLHAVWSLLNQTSCSVLSVAEPQNWGSNRYPHPFTMLPASLHHGGFFGLLCVACHLGQW